jgi:ethanolamine utilization protein EutN
MQTARVIGTATATIRHSSLAGWRLLVLEPLDIAGQADGSPLLAIDHLGAGRNDTVIFTSDAKYAQQVTGRRDTPIRYSIQGIVDNASTSNDLSRARKK